MKKTSFAIAALMLVFGIACTPEDNTPKEVLATAIELSAHELTLEKGANAILTVTFTPSNATKRDIAWVSSNTGIATVNDGVVVGVASGETEIIAKCGEAVDRCKVTVPGPPKGAVDLGIVMTREDGTTYNLYWAESNLCGSYLCNNPEDYGDYYAWGETEIKPDYSWSTYKFGTSASGPFSKYNTISSYGAVDNKTELDPEDDAAHIKLGGKWRMPTDSEWTALREKCTWAWTTRNGISGYKVTGSNGDSIFLPAGGLRYETRLAGDTIVGNYLSSSLVTDSPYLVWYIYFHSDSIHRLGIERYCGLTIRPVSE